MRLVSAWYLLLRVLAFGLWHELWSARLWHQQVSVVFVYPMRLLLACVDGRL